MFSLLQARTYFLGLSHVLAITLFLREICEIYLKNVTFIYSCYLFYKKQIQDTRSCLALSVEQNEFREVQGIS